jgi:hypothetical protein
MQMNPINIIAGREQTKKKCEWKKKAKVLFLLTDIVAVEKE